MDYKQQQKELRDKVKMLKAGTPIKCSLCGATSYVTLRNSKGRLFKKTVSIKENNEGVKVCVDTKLCGLLKKLAQNKNAEAKEEKEDTVCA